MNQKIKINLTFNHYNEAFINLNSKGEQMKINKILGILAILGFLSTTTFAEDFLAKLTNGAISDTSEGVRLLSAEEERNVVGGIMAGLLGGNYTIDNSGNKIMMYAYYQLSLSADEQNRGIAYASRDYESVSQLAQNYLDFKWLTVVNPEVEIPAMLVQYNYKTRQYTTEVLAYNPRNGTQRRIQQSFPLIQKLNNSLRSNIINHASQYR